MSWRYHSYRQQLYDRASFANRVKVSVLFYPISYRSLDSWKSSCDVSFVERATVEARLCEVYGSPRIPVYGVAYVKMISDCRRVFVTFACSLRAATVFTRYEFSSILAYSFQVIDEKEVRLNVKRNDYVTLLLSV